MEKPAVLLYAEDAGLLHERDALLNYLREFSANQMREAVINLFAVLDTPEDARSPYLPENLCAFPYVNGGLFGNDDIIVPQFNEQVRLDLLRHANGEAPNSKKICKIFLEKCEVLAN